MRKMMTSMGASVLMLSAATAWAQAVTPPAVPPRARADVKVQQAPGGGVGVDVNRGGPGAQVQVQPGGDVNVKAPVTGGAIVRDPAAVQQRSENRQDIRDDRRDLRELRANDARRDSLRQDIRQERRENRDITGDNIRSGAAATTNNADQWRFKYHNNHWWYYTPKNSWVFWYNNNWQPYDANTYYDYYPRRGAAYNGRYSTGYRGIRRGTIAPNQGTMNGANIGGAIDGQRGANIGAAIGNAVDNVRDAAHDAADTVRDSNPQ